MALTHMDDRFPSDSGPPRLERATVAITEPLSFPQWTKHWDSLTTTGNLRLLVIFKGSIQ